jgi:hypothetical protein
MDVDGRLNTVTFALVRSIYRNKSFQAFSDVLRATGRDLAAGDLGNCKLPRGTLSAKES